MQTIVPVSKVSSFGPQWAYASTQPSWNQLGWFGFLSNQNQPNQPAPSVSAHNHYSRRVVEEIKMSLTSNLKDFIAAGFASIEEVERVYTVRRPREDVIYVRVVLQGDDRNLRKKVYAKEREIIDAFEIFEFDFGIASSLDSIDPTLELVYKKKP